MKIRAICISLWERLVIQSISAGNATSLLFRGWLFLSLPFCVILQQPFTAYRAADVPVIWVVARADRRTRTANLSLTRRLHCHCAISAYPLIKPPWLLCYLLATIPLLYFRGFFRITDYYSSRSMVLSLWKSFLQDFLVDWFILFGGEIRGSYYSRCRTWRPMGTSHRGNTGSRNRTHNRWI